MRTEKKLWGVARHKYADDSVQLVEIEGDAGAASSLHHHEKKENTFLVGSGQIDIYYADEGGDEYLRTSLTRQDQPFSVPSMQRHRMVFRTETKAVELYCADPGEVLDVNDIVRHADGWAAAG